MTGWIVFGALIAILLALVATAFVLTLRRSNRWPAIPDSYGKPQDDLMAVASAVREPRPDGCAWPPCTWFDNRADRLGFIPCTSHRPAGKHRRLQSVGHDVVFANVTDITERRRRP
jgi:hypothetical protein